MLLVANLVKYKMMQKNWKLSETLAHGYSSESSQWELSNEYQHDRAWMVFKNICVLMCFGRKLNSSVRVTYLHSGLGHFIDHGSCPALNPWTLPSTAPSTCTKPCTPEFLSATAHLNSTKPCTPKLLQSLHPWIIPNLAPLNSYQTSQPWILSNLSPMKSY